MKTIAQVRKENPDKVTLINAVISKLGNDYIMDVVNHGADAGYPGFTYYTDTHKFSMRHRKAIVAMLEEQAADFGQEVIEMVSNFGVFRQSPMDNDDRKNLYKYLGGGRCDQGTITNLMAWYALEEICRLFDN